LLELAAVPRKVVPVEGGGIADGIVGNGAAVSLRQLIASEGRKTNDIKLINHLLLRSLQPPHQAMLDCFSDKDRTIVEKKTFVWLLCHYPSGKRSDNLL
jgi:hypothetical protein